MGAQKVTPAQPAPWGRDLVIEYFDDVALVLGTRNLRLMEINGTGALILRGLERGEAMESIIDRLAEPHGFESGRVRADAERFLKEFHRWVSLDRITAAEGGTSQ